MANRFVDSTTGLDTDTGANFDLAWATNEHAHEAGGLNAADLIFIRPNHSEIPLSDILPIYDGTVSSPIRFISWPKAAFAITSATWTNGSTTVDLVLPATLTRTGHSGRYVTAPNGDVYFITRVIDSNTFIIDREYAGATVTLTNGAASIIKDAYYDTAQAIDDSAWTIKKTDWDANNPARGIIDFNDGAYNIFHAGDSRFVYEGLELKDSTDSGIIRLNYSVFICFIGCLFKQSAANESCVYNVDTSALFKACIFEGSGSGASQRAFTSSGKGAMHLKDCAINNFGNHGFCSQGITFAENLNIGVEQANGAEDIFMDDMGKIYGRDIKMDGTNGYVRMTNNTLESSVSIENFQKVLGEHRTFFPGGYYERKAVTGETPNKKLSDYILKITPNDSGYEFIPDLAFAVFTDKFKVSSGSKTIRYWIYNDMGVTLNDTTAKDNIWLKIEYVKTYDDTSEYAMTEVFSAQIDILDAANADDWDYLEAAINPPVASEVRATIYFSKYSAAGNTIIDTKRVVT